MPGRCQRCREPLDSRTVRTEEGLEYHATCYLGIAREVREEARTAVADPTATAAAIVPAADSAERWAPVPGCALLEFSTLGRMRSWRKRGRGNSGQRADEPRPIEPYVGMYKVQADDGRTLAFRPGDLMARLFPTDAGKEVA